MILYLSPEENAYLAAAITCLEATIEDDRDAINLAAQYGNSIASGEYMKMRITELKEKVYSEHENLWPRSIYLSTPFTS